MSTRLQPGWQKVLGVPLVLSTLALIVLKSKRRSSHRPKCVSSPRQMSVSASPAQQVQARVVVKYGPGVGVNSNIEKEVVHVSLQIINSTGSGIVQSQDAFEPYCFHDSRRWALEIANARRGEIDALGFGGPAVVFRIPGIPFPQEQDTGLHISLYNQPRQHGVSYSAPDMAKCIALEGQIFTVTIDGALKILNGNEQNDFKVGGCYYVSLSCGDGTRSLANDIRNQVGLPLDESQQFHLSLAVIAPVWLPCHTKSIAALQATQEVHAIWHKYLQVFRHGDPIVGFTGFNDNETTEWTNHANNIEEAGKKNVAIKAAIEGLAKSDDYDARKQALQQQIVDIPRTFGMCKTVGAQETIVKIKQPDFHSQQTLNQHFRAPVGQVD